VRPTKHEPLGDEGLADEVRFTAEYAVHEPLAHGTEGSKTNDPVSVPPSPNVTPFKVYTTRALGA
jgi:hypothetical protein